FLLYLILTALTKTFFRKRVKKRDSPFTGTVPLFPTFPQQQTESHFYIIQIFCLIYILHKNNIHTAYFSAVQTVNRFPRLISFFYGSFHLFIPGYFFFNARQICSFCIQITKFAGKAAFRRFFYRSANRGRRQCFFIFIHIKAAGSETVIE